MHRSFFHSLYMIFVYFFIKFMKMYYKKSCTYCEHKIMSYFFFSICAWSFYLTCSYFFWKSTTQKNHVHSVKVVWILWFQAELYGLDGDIVYPPKRAAKAVSNGAHLTSFYLIIVKETISTISKCVSLTGLFEILW